MVRALSGPRGTQEGGGLEASPFLLPAYGLFLLFMVLPVLEALWLSLHREDLFGRGREWVALGNHGEALTRPEFWKSALLTPKFTLMVAPLELFLVLLVLAALQFWLLGRKVHYA